MNFVDHGMASNWPVNIHHLLGRVAASGDFGYGGAGAMMGGGKMKQVEAWDQMPTPESAFLGPQLWDRKICMKMNEMGWSVGHSGYQQRGYSDAAHSDSGHSTPSPTNFHQVTRHLGTLLAPSGSSVVTLLGVSLSVCPKIIQRSLVSCL